MMRRELLRRRLGLLVTLAAIAGAAGATGAAEPDAGPAAAARRLIAAYPDFLAGYDGGAIVWKDGARTAFDDGRSDKTPAERLAAPSLADMLREPYPAGAPLSAPEAGADPGRIRNAAFFDRMYGDCSKGWAAAWLVDVVWLPRKWGKAVRFSGVNGAAEALRRVSAELDALPASFDRFLSPPAGTAVCRDIAGAGRRSAHGWGIAIDLATGPSHYWRWSGGAAARGRDADWQPVRGWRNAFPTEIVAAFERHGFIWGGRWNHYDTMHFEYRPELFDTKP